MKTITSTEFQKAYPKLTEPHEVTALGRPIGRWYPVDIQISTMEQSTLSGQQGVGHGFNTRPFTPVPKKGK